MAKKVTTTRVFSDTDEEQPVQAEPVQDLTWAAFKGKFGTHQGAKVKVYRQTPKGRQFCFMGTPSEIESEETIRAYHASTAYAHEEGHYLLALESDGVVGEFFPVEIAPQIATPGQALQTNNGGMADVIMRRFEALEQRMMSREQTPMVEMVQALAQLDQLRGGQKSEMSVDNMLKLIELGKGLGGTPGGDWTDKLIDAVKDNAPLLLGIFQRMQSGQPAQPAMPVHHEAVQEVVPVVQKEGGAEVPSDFEKQMLKSTIGYLKKKALAGSDPGLYVDLVLDNQEDPIYAKLISEIADNDFSTFARVIDPDIEKPQYVEFFSGIYNRLRSVIIKSDPVAAAGVGKGGNKADPGSNGATGKGGKK